MSNSDTVCWTDYENPTTVAAIPDTLVSAVAAAAVVVQ